MSGRNRSPLEPISGGFCASLAAWLGVATRIVGVVSAQATATSDSFVARRVLEAPVDRIGPLVYATAGVKGLEYALLGLLLLVYAGLNLNPLTARLLPVAVFFLVFYSYTKRFTWLCHYVLGLTIGAAAAGGWIAVTGSFAPTAYALWAGVGLWIAGFDILYATQDYAFDRAHGVKSIPARFGIPQALRVARASHLLAWLAFLWAGVSYGAGPLYYLGLLLVGGLLLLEHRLVSPEDLSKVEVAFFQANVGVSLGMFLFIVLDLLARGA